MNSIYSINEFLTSDSAPSAQPKGDLLTHIYNSKLLNNSDKKTAPKLAQKRRFVNVNNGN
jgi:hypothetical protein